MLYVGTRGYIYILDPKEGKIKLSHNLNFTGFHAVSLLVEESTQTIYATSHGYAFAYHAETLVELWNNDMSGMGFTNGKFWRENIG